MTAEDLEWTADGTVGRYHLLGVPSGPELQGVVDLAALVCRVPHVTLRLLTPDGERQVSATGLDLAESGEVRFEDSVDLVGPDGAVAGRIRVYDDRPRELTGVERQALEQLAARAVDFLELRLCSAWLDDTREELAVTRDELARAQEHLTLFAGQVSHDLRTPLTAVLANVEMLAGEPSISGDPDVEWMVDGIGRAARRMNTMIEEMIDYAREGGEPSLGVTDLRRVWDLALDDLSPMLSEARAEVTVGTLPVLPADARQMYFVAHNLLSNALRFARPDEPPRVTVGAERRGERWRVSVTDNGVGVPADRQDAMFVLFARADKRSGGAGLGLATAKRVVEAHGGRIAMESAEGGGTVVWFELPA